ncbi:Hpt domain-containing protein [Rhodoplanes azumiensis]|uniref:Hpt domain-containing protein n=1 Tax=Rhodoplanes azumiensis TaxID=1897628 RepID=A0ABW5AQ46_9BRAD
MHSHFLVEPPAVSLPLPAADPDAMPIDLAHLFRMTLGDARLQAEVLDLFDQQIALLVARMDAAPPAAMATLAHTLKGSARGVGAWAIVTAAEAIEAAVATGAAVDGPLAAMDRAGSEARAAIARLRQDRAAE